MLSLRKRDILIAIACTFLSLVLVQHTLKVAQVRDQFLPSTILLDLCKSVENGWNWLGTQFAWVSSFLKHLHIDKLLESMGQIIIPCIRLSLSWVKFLFGYREYIKEYATSVHPITVYIGSALLIMCIITVIIHHYANIIPNIIAWVAYLNQDQRTVLSLFFFGLIIIVFATLSK